MIVPLSSAVSFADRVMGIDRHLVGGGYRYAA